MPAPLPQLTMPDELPWFRARGHVVEPTSQYAHPKFQTGHSRARRVWTATERIVGVSMLLDEERSALFDAWYEGPLQDAGGVFSAKVINDEVGDDRALWYRAEFEAPPNERARPRGWWVMTTKLRLTGPGQVDGPYTGELGAVARLVLTGSVRGTVEPTLGATAELALQELFRLPAASATIAVEQPVYFAAECVCALEET